MVRRDTFASSSSLGLKVVSEGHGAPEQQEVLLRAGKIPTWSSEGMWHPSIIKSPGEHQTNTSRLSKSPVTSPENTEVHNSVALCPRFYTRKVLKAITVYDLPSDSETTSLVSKDRLIKSRIYSETPRQRLLVSIQKEHSC